LISPLKEGTQRIKSSYNYCGSFEAGDFKRGAVMSSLILPLQQVQLPISTAALKNITRCATVGEQEVYFVRGGAGYESKQ